MSPDEIERTVQFLLQQQSQFDGRIDRLAHKTEQVSDALIGLTAIAGHLFEAQKRTDEQLRELTQRVITVESHIQTVDSHLGAVVQMFERHLRDDHGLRPS